MIRRIITACLLILWIIACSRHSEQAPENISWMTDVDSAKALAEAENKPILIDFMATWCPPCQKMEDSTFSHPDVIQKSRRFVNLRIDVDEQGDVADYFEGNAGKYGGVGIPNILFITHDETRLKHIIGYYRPEMLTAVMDSVLLMRKFTNR
ncbi:MAG TPA: thioredoxin family protein [bacterium]|nr:thioredoxin family protein [bacterium]